MISHWNCRFSALVLALPFLLGAFIPSLGAAQSAPLASIELEIRGHRLTLYADPESGAADAEQTINIGERAQVRTCFGGSAVACGAVQPGDPRIAGLRVVAELSGPELPDPLTVETVPGGSFLLPGFQQEGDYFLENIRLVSGQGEAGQVLSLAEPPLAVLHVRQIVLGSATVRALSLADLRARGIELTQESFQAFDFALGFAIEGQTVEIKFPVLFEGNGLATALDKPWIDLDGLPAEVVRLVQAWKPPIVLPIRMEPAPAGPGGLEIGEENPEDLRYPLYGAIVIPGTVTYLNQFFEARLLVANGAPAGSGAELSRLRALARLPGDRSLRLADTEPAVVAGQWLPVITESGSQRIPPAGQGSAAWVVEGLRAGTHSLIFEIEGQLERPGREPMLVRSLAQAAVEVVDARFQLTFSHPDVVRADEEYTLFVTVTNQSRAAQNQIAVEIRDESLTGAAPADPQDPLRRSIPTLAPGESATVEFELVSQLTGSVIASTYQSESANIQGTIQLRAGVGELGIPLSPATLVMPRFTSELEARDPRLVRSTVALLGLAHSLAVAPASLLPPGIASLQKADVERRAIDLAEAGERIFLGDRLLESVEALAFDQLGNRHPLAGYDQLRRKTAKGLRAAESLAARLRAEQQDRLLDAEELVDHLAETMSYARPYLAAVVIPQDGGGGPLLEAIDRLGGAGLLAGTADREGAAVRTLPWGEMYALRATAGAESPRASLALVGHLENGATTTFLLRHPGGTEAVRGRLVLIAPDGASGLCRKIVYDSLTLEPGEVLAIDAGALVAGPGQGGFRPYDPATGERLAAAPRSELVPLPPFLIIGARQDFYLDYSVDVLGNRQQPNRYGNGITYLFNRPPAAGLSQQPEAFAIESEFPAGETTQYSSRKAGQAAFIQPNSERVAIVRYDAGISALIEGGRPLVRHRHDLATGAIRDQHGQALAAPIPEPQIDVSPLHVGALVAGKVRRGTGLAVGGVKVELIRHRWVQKLNGDWALLADRASTTHTDGNGDFFFDFHETPHQDRNIKPEFFLRATVPPGADPLTEPGEVAEVSFIARRQNEVARVNIALLGRGGISGRLTYLDSGAPVAGGTVEAASTLFQEMQRVAVDGEGNFRFLGLPVGPISLAGRDPQGRRVYATVEIAGPGAVAEAALQIQRPNSAPPGRGAVHGRILFLRDGAEEEALGATVAVYSEGNFVASQIVGPGAAFSFADVPAGRVGLQAANFRVSRSAVYTDLLLAAGETREVELRIPASSPKRVAGKVMERGADGSLRELEGATVLLVGPGNLTRSAADGGYLLEDVPIQSIDEPNFILQIVHPDRTRELRVQLPRILAGEDEVIAETVVFAAAAARGTVRGIVRDPLGRPVPNAAVVLYPLAEKRAAADGTFLFEQVPLSSYHLVAHVDDGLSPGKVGYLARSPGFTLDGPASDRFVELRMVGSGFVRVRTRTATSTGVLTPIAYRPTYYSEAAKDILMRGAYLETSTDPNGLLELELPLGDFEIVAANPFNGRKEVRGTLSAIGQVAEYEIVFESLGKVRGQVVANDGVTPVPFAEVKLSTSSLLPQSLQADQDGRFLYELVPAGQVIVDARAMVGNVERVGRTLSGVRQGEEVELRVVMLAQGSIRGYVRQETAPGLLAAVPRAQYYVRETSYPNRRLPEGEGNYYFTDETGYYEVPRLFAGNAAIVARDSHDVSREGRARATIEVDWSIVTVPDIVFRGADALGRITFRVRDKLTGGPVADALVRLSTGEGSVTGADGTAVFEALKVSPILPGEKYFARAFYAPTGQAGESPPVYLRTAGQDEAAEIQLDLRGEIRGLLYADPSRNNPIAGAALRIDGTSVAGRIEGLTTSSGEAGSVGLFVFSGIPEGTYQITAAPLETPRRATTTVTLTATSPMPNLLLFLEEVGDRHFRIDQKLRAGNRPADLAGGVYSVKLWQGDPLAPTYSFTSLLPEPGTGVFLFRNLFFERAAGIEARELTGELRQLNTSTPDFLLRSRLLGAGTVADPHPLVLPPKGTVVARVLDAGGNPVPGANVRLVSQGASYSRATGTDGRATFLAVESGEVTISSASLDGVSSSSARSVIQFDDDLIELTLRYQPAVRAAGKIYSPPENDQAVGDPSHLPPMAGARVELTDRNGNRHLTYADAQGSFLFEGLPAGVYGLSAASPDGAQIASASGVLSGPDGNLNQLPGLVLDGGPPRIVMISPGAGQTGVATTAQVRILFSEPLASAFQPVGPVTPHFSLRKSIGGVPVAGNWVSRLDLEGRQEVLFVPSGDLEDFTLYTLTVSGAVTDRAGRRLAASGNVGSSFRTADGSGPAIIGTEPTLGRPVHPEASIRLDFSERIVAGAEELDGDGNADALLLEAQKLDGSWVALPAVYYLTRLDFSLQVDLPQGLTVPGDSLRRRLSVSRLRDERGLAMQSWQREFRIYDENPPSLALAMPAGAPDGTLYRSVSYTLAPALGNLDDLPALAPAGDADRVEYFFADPAASGSAPGYVARSHPFSYTFDAAYFGDGEPRPFPVWVRAVDTSDNASPVVRLDLRVLPNAVPAIGAVTASAASGSFYHGQVFHVTVDGIGDQDSASLSLLVEFLRADSQPPRLIRQASATLVRPPGGWVALAAPTLQFPPQDSMLPEGTPFFFRARVADDTGSAASADSAPLSIADDTIEPRVSSIAALAGSTPGLVFTIGDQIHFTFTANDPESGLKSARVVFDRTDLFPAPLEVYGLYPGATAFSASVRVPASIGEPTEVVATVEVEDFGGNTRRAPLAFIAQPAADPFAPAVSWASPFAGALWPAEYESVLPGAGVPLLLRVRASDSSRGPAGEIMPGELFSVEIRGPELAPDGTLRLAESWRPAARIHAPGSSAAGDEYELLWHVPNDLPAGAMLDFAVRAIDLGGSQTIATVQMQAVAARQVMQGVSKAILPDDPMLDFASEDPNGPVFLLDGSVVSIYPRPGGELRTLPSLFIYSGGFTSSGILQRRVSRLRPVEINSLDSAVPFYPLELGIESFLGVAGGASIDGDGAGLLGGTASRPIALPGIAGQQAGEPGFHAGMWAGNLSLAELLRVYGDPRWPLLPGLGGRTSRVSSDYREGGGPGGGAIRIAGAAATVRVEGEISARGLLRARGGSLGGPVSGGAGGSIAVEAALIDGGGWIDASAERGSLAGGGGRIALRAAQLGEALAAGGARAWGGGSVYLESTSTAGGDRAPGRLIFGTEPGRPLHESGISALPGLGSGLIVAVDVAASRLTLQSAPAGPLAVDALIVVEQAGEPLGKWPVAAHSLAAGPQAGQATLEVAAGEQELGLLAAALAAGPLPFHGELRYASLELRGAVKVLVRDDLALGPADAPSAIIDDPAFIQRDPEARLKLRGDRLSLAATSSVPEGELPLLRQILVSYTAADRLGLLSLEERWTGGQPSVTGGGTEVEREARHFTAAAGPLELELKAVSLDGETVEKRLRWTVLPNQGPAARIEPQSPSADPGAQLRVRAVASDREGLAGLRLLIDGPWGLAEQLLSLPDRPVAVDHVFLVSIPVDAAAGPLRLMLQARDHLDLEASAEATVTIAAGGTPSATWSALGDPLDLPAGERVGFHLVAADADGNLKEARLVSAEGPIELFTPELPAAVLAGVESDWEFREARVAWNAEDGEQIVLRAEVEDHAGNVFELPPLVFTVIGDHQPPVLLASFPESVTIGNALSGTVDAIDFALERIALEFAGETIERFVEPGQAQVELTTSPVSERPLPASLPLSIRAYDRSGNVATIERQVEILADLPPIGSLEISPQVYDPAVGGWVIIAGGEVVVGLWAGDDVALASARLRLTGLVDREESFELAERDGYASLSFTVPASAQPGDSFVLSGSVTDSRGQTTVLDSVEGAVTLYGLAPPELRLYLDPENPQDSYPSGTVLQVVATARKGLHESADLTIELDGRSEPGSGVAAGEWTLPEVTEPTVLPLHVVATGVGGLVEEITRRIVVLPSRPAAGVAFDAPSGGAILPAGTTIDFHLSAEAASGIESIELYAGATLAGTVTPAGSPAAYQGTLAVTLPAQPGQLVYRAVVRARNGASAQATAAISAVAASLLADPRAPIDWTTFAGETIALGAGTWVPDAKVKAARLILLPGARLTHGPPAADPEAPRPRLELEATGAIYVARGAAVDTSGGGLADPANALGGGHVGAGGLASAGTGSSIYRPRKPGGGSGASRGGGVAWISAGRLVVDGEILSQGDGDSAQTGGGAGGSLWLRVAGELSGGGRISADGASSSSAAHGSGGGGVVSLEYGSLAPRLRERISAKGGAGAHPGGAGIVLLKGSGDALGQLLLDGGSQPGAASGPLVVVPRPNPDLPAYEMEGNWLRILVSNSFEPEDYIGALIACNGAHFRVIDARWPPEIEECPPEDPFCLCGSGGLCPESLKRAASSAVALAPGALAPESGRSGLLELELRQLDGSDVEPGSFDSASFEGVILADRISLRGHHRIGLGGLSAPAVEIDGQSGSLGSFTAESVYLRRGARLEAAEGAASGGLQAQISAGDLILSPAARIDASLAGRPAILGQYPAGAGHSHIGSGGGLELHDPSFLTYDDPFDPAEPGRHFAGSASGGGALAIEAEVAYLAPGSALLANGGAATVTGGSSGGSLRLVARRLAGDGRLEAHGGASATQHGGGGGGILVQWQEASGSFARQARACGGGAGKEAGGAGTVLLLPPWPAPAELVLDNCGRSGPITYGIEPGSAEILRLLGGARIVWPSVVEGAGRLELSGPGTFENTSIEAESLTISGGGILSLPAAAAGLPLVLRLAEELVIESGGRIDVSGDGLAGAYPNLAGTGGNHLGFKGYSNPANRGATYGSVLRPAEPGTGGSGFRGGGVVDIEAGRVFLAGAGAGILANGQGTAGTAAGGSVRLRTGELRGDGFIEARGAAGGTVGGGGGAIAIEYDAAEGSWQDHLRAWGGNASGLPGGAGTVFLFDRRQAVDGVLRLANGGRAGATDLPSLGAGIAASGTSGATLVTHLTAIPSFFAGHRVEVARGGQLIGLYQVESAAGNALQLAAENGAPVELQPGDSWQGFYRFDRLESEILVSYGSGDSLRAPRFDYPGDGLAAGGSALEAIAPELDWLGGSSAGEIDLAAIAIERAEIEGIYRITVPATIFPAERHFDWIRLRDPARTLTAAWDPRRGASFLWAGEPGSRLQLQAFDPQRPRWPLNAELPPLPAGGASGGLGVHLDPEERLVDLLSAGRAAYLLLEKSSTLELLELDLAANEVRSLGKWPGRDGESRLVLRDGAIAIDPSGPGADGEPFLP